MALLGPAQSFPKIAEYGVGLDPDACFLACLYVWPDFRGRGLGRALLGAVVDRARNTGFRSVATLARRGSENNPSGPLGFYLARGWSILSENPDHPEWPVCGIDLSTP